MCRKILSLFCIAMLLICYSCGKKPSEQIEIYIESHESDELFQGLNGINLSTIIVTRKPQPPSMAYNLVLYFYYVNKNLVMAEDTVALQKPYIRDLGYTQSQSGSLIYIREKVNLRRSGQAEFTIFVPYEILPFYNKFLTTAEPYVFHLKLYIFEQGNLSKAITSVASSDEYYSISLQPRSTRKD